MSLATFSLSFVTRSHQNFFFNIDLLSFITRNKFFSASNLINSHWNVANRSLYNSSYISADNGVVDNCRMDLPHRDCKRRQNRLFISLTFILTANLSTHKTNFVHYCLLTNVAHYTKSSFSLTRWLLSIHFQLIYFWNIFHLPRQIQDWSLKIVFT